MSFEFIEEHPSEVEDDLFFNDHVLGMVKEFIKNGWTKENNDPVLFELMFKEVDSFMEVGLTEYEGNLIRMMIDNHEKMPLELAGIIYTAAELKEISFNELHNASTRKINCFPYNN